jgi:sigma-B regulation protein RsbU (phosphoserine phosphatase)
MGFLRKIYDKWVYSEFGRIIGSVFILTFFFLIAFLGESYFSKTIYKVGFLGLPFIFEFGNLVLLFLIVNICMRSIKTAYRLRMIIYMIFFALGAGVNFIVFSNVHWFSGEVSYESLTILASLGKLVIALGLILGSIAPIERKVKQFKAFYLILGVFLLWLTFAWISLRVNTGKFNIKLLIPDVAWNTAFDYSTAVLLILAFAIQYRNYLLGKNRYLLIFMNGLAILIIAQVIRLSYIQYTYFFQVIYSSYLFIGYIYIFNAIFGYNIVSPIQNLINEEKQIKLYAENLEVIVERRTKEMQHNNLRLIQEIEYAKSIQQSLLPARKVNFNKVVFLSEYFPCERLSGDFFDIYRLDEENIGMYVLDVSGHGVSAALMTMFCNNYIKSSEKLIMKYRGLKPHRNLKHFYDEFNKMNFPDEMYMVMFFASYNVETGILTYASGGINCYPILMKRNGTMAYLDQSKGFPICKMSDFFTPTFTSETVQLDKGDRVIFYTDGLIDNVKNQTISEEELEKVLFDYRNRSLKSLNDKIKSYIEKNLSDSEDDITYFVMEV